MTSIESVSGFGFSGQSGHNKRYAIDERKIEKELAWVPEETFDSGLRKTVLWYLSNRDWCDGINYIKKQKVVIKLKE